MQAMLCLSRYSRCKRSMHLSKGRRRLSRAYKCTSGMYEELGLQYLD
ncbi:hypothetical protein SmJEL517_g02481 [Synchytrium microbalum]|uniref:Uncharacterized protein n=1 Tax=Synchytrium microbalum TaxID=1806994 RepID=A0A507C6D8_9FUNG|nr:uncharacterized protein SmJEL517_g02481 [Synchytrium microbalum]TPX35071.1 hypothetical protein SmJEL517_g02481 [Synchytrium microbalum]